MISRDITLPERDNGAWWISVTKDAVLPTVNANNPVLSTLLTKGVPREALAGIWITKKITDWGALADTDKGHDIHVFTRSDACGAASTWANFLGKDQEDLEGIGVYGDPGLAEAVIKDTLGIGYNNVNYVFDRKTLVPIKGIHVLPIDLNANGRIDEDEDFYENQDTMIQAIASGLYPSPPARDLHFVCKGKPSKKLVVEFIEWVLTEGQHYIPDAGYIPLPEERLRLELNKLKNDPTSN
jgi:phosphate transport system substrate-binding protein